MDVMFSIIIPHYNTPVYLMRLLDSINKRDNSTQVIVVDDQSTVDMEVFSECKKKYQRVGIEFYKNEGKKGAGTCRNIGLKYAVGKWILFADADDIFLPEYERVIKQYEDSEADIVFFLPTSKEEDTGEISTRHIAIEKYIYNYHSNVTGRKENIELKYHHVMPWSKLIRHSVINNNNIYFEEVLYSNDVMFSTKLAYCSNMIETSLTSIYCCMRNDGSLTTSINISAYRIRRSVWLRRYLFLRKYLTKEDFKLLNLSGANYILSGIHQRVKITVILETIRLFKKNHVKIIPAGLFTKEFLQEHVLLNLCEWKEAKKYYSKKNDEIL